MILGCLQRVPAFIRRLLPADGREIIRITKSFHVSLNETLFG